LQARRSETVQAQQRHQGGQLLAVHAGAGQAVMVSRLKQAAHDLRSVGDRVEHQVRLGLGQVGPGPVPVLRRASTTPTRAPQIGPPRLGAGDLLDAQAHVPGGEEVVLVDEPFALA